MTLPRNLTVNGVGPGVRRRQLGTSEELTTGMKKRPVIVATVS